MKALIESVVCLAIGLSVGFYVGYHYYERCITNEAVEQMVQGIDSSERFQAGMALRSITLIESGESSNAVQFLSRRVGDFYGLYAGLTHNDERTKQLLAMIEQVAGTNAVVADADSQRESLMQICGLTSRRSQPPLALSVPLSRFTPRVGGGSAFLVRPRENDTKPSCRI